MAGGGGYLPKPNHNHTSSYRKLTFYDLGTWDSLGKSLNHVCSWCQWLHLYRSKSSPKKQQLPPAQPLNLCLRPCVEILAKFFLEMNSGAVQVSLSLSLSLLLPFSNVKTCRKHMYRTVCLCAHTRFCIHIHTNIDIDVICIHIYIYICIYT